MSDPRVTVLLCVYNGEAFVRDAIDSILAQTWRDFELLIVDDGSTDGTPAILRSLTDERVRVLRNVKNLGLTASLNVGLRAARGELIARHDADDVSRPQRLARQVAFLDASPEVVAAGTQYVSIGEHGRRQRLHLWMKCETWMGIRWQLLFENPFVHSSVMFRRDAVLAAGGYDESFRTNQDFELWSRLSRHHPLRNIPERLVELRARALSISRRYSLEAIRKVGDVLIANAAATLGVDLSGDRRAIDDLLQATNPHVYPPVESLETITRWIDDAYRRYVARWPEARHVGEIRAHAASVIARLATISAATSPLKMAPWYLRTARYHLPTFVRGLPRYGLAVARTLLHRPRALGASPTTRNPDQEAK